MKTKLARLLLLTAAMTALQGCIAFPPLVQVEHKDNPQNQQQIITRLDAIDRRLDAMDEKIAKK